MKRDERPTNEPLAGTIPNVAENLGPALLDGDAKQRDLAPQVRDPTGRFLTTDQGLRISDNDNSLKAGARGPTLLQDFLFREKMTHFDHERIPERVVHARGSGAHGYFQVYESLEDLTCARFLCDPSRRTPVFVRFSTVVGSRGSADTVRDVRGFATKFYTDEGNFDLVGNNIPVFFIQDGIKFPDLIHAAKPEPDVEIPQASTAHDTFYDFISLQPESLHMILWVFSDRAIPRSYRMMEGFGVHTFRLVNAAGQPRFVKFHWKPLLGVHSLVWDEAQKIAGKDPDFHRRDLYEAIASGHFPEWELGLQVVDPTDEFAFDFDLLDATKIIPEELVPVRRVGRLVLNRNPTEFFAETEQVAFHLSNVVPGIDFTNDPLLQARLFSYLDTQLLRLGGPNFAQIPINRPLTQVHNNHQGGFMRQVVHRGRVTYSPSALSGGCPMTAGKADRGFLDYAEKIEGYKIRQRSASFEDHFTQARLFYQSLTPVEQRHVILAAHFELGRVESLEIRQRMVALLSRVDALLGQQVAAGIGVDPSAAPPPTEALTLQGGHTWDGPVVLPGQAPTAGTAGASPPEAASANAQMKRSIDRSPSLSQLAQPRPAPGVATRRVAVLLADGVRGTDVAAASLALREAGAVVHLISAVQGPIVGEDQTRLVAQFSTLHVGSVLYDAVFIPGGTQSVAALLSDGDMVHFVAEAFKHCKPIGATAEATQLLRHACPAGLALADSAQQSGAPSPDSAQQSGAPSIDGGVIVDRGVVSAREASVDFMNAFLLAIAAHRAWERERGPAQLTSA